MNALTGQAAAFLALHTPGTPPLQANAFESGSARLLEALGSPAIAHHQQRSGRHLGPDRRAYAAVIAAATELREAGTYGCWEAVSITRDQIRSAFGA